MSKLQTHCFFPADDAEANTWQERFASPEVVVRAYDKSHALSLASTAIAGFYEAGVEADLTGKIYQMLEASSHAIISTDPGYDTIGEAGLLRPSIEEIY